MPIKWEKVKPGQKLKPGDPIKLGGRIGSIEHMSGGQLQKVCHQVKWDDGHTDNRVFLSCFPDLEIAAPTPTITQEAVKEIMSWCSSQPPLFLHDFLNSLID